MRRARRSLVPAAAFSGLVGLTACMPSHRMAPGQAALGRTCPDLEARVWYLPESRADNERLERWCVSVGPEVVREQPPASFETLRPGGELTVLSWNVAAGGGDLLAFLEHEAGLRCLGPESRLESGGVGPFVLLVQEAFRRSAAVPEAASPDVIPRAAVEEDRPGERPDIVEVAERCGLSVAYVAAARNGDASAGQVREDRGVAILSTLPLSEVWFVELPYEAARRVAVGATIRDASGAGVRLVDVHLTSAAPPFRTLVTGNGSRLRQGLALVDALEQAEAAGGERPARDADLSTLLGGDLNTWSENESTLRKLRDWFPDSPASLEGPTRGAFPTDHILFRQGTGATARLVDSTYVRLSDRHHSDHHGIRVRLRFPG